MAGNLTIGLMGAQGDCCQHPDRRRVGASGKICFSSDIENANYKVVKK
jgi:hypothetical protein